MTFFLMLFAFYAISESQQASAIVCVISALFTYLINQ